MALAITNRPPKKMDDDGNGMVVFVGSWVGKRRRTRVKNKRKERESENMFMHAHCTHNKHNDDEKRNGEERGEMGGWQQQTAGRRPAHHSRHSFSTLANSSEFRVECRAEG